VVKVKRTVNGWKNSGLPWSYKLNSNNDTRRGITILVRIPDNIKREISSFLSTLEHLEPSQYYYPLSDLHVTILSIISCRPGFQLTDFRPEAYCQEIKHALKSVTAFQIEFSGITASTGCIMIQGYPKGSQLDQLRANLREGFRESGLESTIDSRYKLITAHITVARFQSPLKDPVTFTDKLNSYRDYNFGTLDVNELEFVYNDWYQKAATTKHIASFKL